MRPAATVVYNYVGIGVQPPVVKGEALPATIYEERKNAIESMDRLVQDQRSGASDTPAGVKSGVALNFLREQKDEESSPRLARCARFHADRKRKQLLLAQRHYREPRAIKLMGAGQQWQVHYWQVADLAGNTDVSIDPGTVIPRSPALKTQLIFDAIENQLIDVTNAATRQKVLEELNLLDYETELGPDKRRAEHENAQMDEGQEVQITENDNHEVHLLEHLPRMKDPSFDYLPEPARRAHKLHKDAHLQALLQQKAMELAGGQQPETPPNGKGPAKPGLDTSAGSEADSAVM